MSLSPSNIRTLQSRGHITKHKQHDATDTVVFKFSNWRSYIPGIFRPDGPGGDSGDRLRFLGDEAVWNCSCALSYSFLGCTASRGARAPRPAGYRNPFIIFIGAAGRGAGEWRNVVSPIGVIIIIRPTRTHGARRCGSRMRIRVR